MALRAKCSRRHFVLHRRSYIVAWGGFAVGAVFTLANLLALLLSRGETAAAWVVLITAPYTFAPSIGFAQLFGFELKKTLDTNPLASWLYLVTFNGVLSAACATGLFALCKVGSKTKGDLHETLE